MKKNNTFRRAAALMAALSITVSLAVPAFADTYYIDYGDITITKNEDGSQTIEQGGEEWTDKAGEETVITTSNTVITTLESDLEGPAAEDSGLIHQFYRKLRVYPWRCIFSFPGAVLSLLNVGSCRFRV